MQKQIYKYPEVELENIQVIYFAQRTFVTIESTLTLDMCKF